jgi:dTDP-glucose 4,6-dehydratase
VVVVDDFKAEEKPYPYPTQLLERKNFKFIKGDISKARTVYTILKQEQPQLIINCVYSRNEALAIKAIAGNYLLLKLANKLKTSRLGFIYISSDEVYGQGLAEKGITSHGSEKDPVAPETILATAQASADLLAVNFGREYNLPVTVVRTSNLFGPYQRAEDLLPSLIIHAINNEDLPLTGDGTEVRTWLYVSDLILFIDKLLHEDSTYRNSNIFNISGDLEISLLSLTELILNYLNKPKELISLHHDQVHLHKRRTLDSSHARESLNWQPKAEFKTALRDTINWYSESLTKYPLTTNL